MSMKALGCHVFAGGFTMGVREVFDVPAQLEIHGLGQETVEDVLGMEFVCGKYWEEWLDRKDLIKDCVFLFGNPRCTGFSCVTAGYDESAHGAWSKPTEDIHQFMRFGIKAGIPVLCWESVQQAWTVGKELLDHLVETMCTPNGYRVCHLFINAASFGNAQHRKRYFFLAYKDDKNFNIVAPDIPERHATVGDIINKPHLVNAKAKGSRFKKRDVYDGDTYQERTKDEQAIMPYLGEGMCLNRMGHADGGVLFEKHAPKLADMWFTRTSAMPFSMHSLCRLEEDNYMPVISGSAGRFVHPKLNRPITLNEMALLMGWPEGVVPKGPNPVGQIGKGIVPAVGTWLAEQVKLYLADYWGKEDWETTYDDKKGEWVGRDFTGHPVAPPEKVIDLTRYCPPKPKDLVEDAA